MAPTKSMQRTVVVFGPAESGVTALVKRRISNKFESICHSTVEDLPLSPKISVTHYWTSTVRGLRTVKLKVIDIPGTRGLGFYRRTMFKTEHIDVGLLCFDTTEDVLDVVEQKYYTEFRKHQPNVPLILVGTKIDLRDRHTVLKSNHVSTEMGLKLADKLGATKYCECSAKRNNGIADVFDKAIDACSTAFNTLQRRGRMYVGIY